jgi:hypothetical protein
MALLLACVLVAQQVPRLSDSPAPAVYWSSNPNLGGETVTIAGSFDGTESLQLCHTAAAGAEEEEQGENRLVQQPEARGCQAVAQADIWNHSAKFVLPRSLPQQPTWLRLAAGGGSAAALSVPLNAPDVWWATSPVGASVAVVAATLRVFGRSLAWDGDKCVSAQDRGATATTKLLLSPAGGGAAISLLTDSATCFEASFELGSVVAGRYDVALATPWGKSRPWGLTVREEPTPTPAKDISVDRDFNGDVAAALQHAATLHMARVLLGARSYELSNPLVVGNGTQLIGHGEGVTTLRFSLGGDGGGGIEKCGSKIYNNTDLYAQGSSVWKDIEYISNVTSLLECCSACAKRLSCTAYALMVREQKCQLKACSLNTEASCAAHTTTNSDRAAAFLTPYRKGSNTPSSPLAAITANGIGWGLSNFTLEIASALPRTKGVHSVGGHSFSITGLNVQLSQQNATSALHLDGTHHFSVSHTTLSQNNLCFWGCTLNKTTNASDCSMHDGSTDFQNSATLQIHAAAWGHLHHNTIRWKCSAYDMDVSSNMIFEDNVLSSTEPGVIPHGNSISFYDWHAVPSSANWSFSHNAMSRPPNNDHRNWNSHETLTTDGPGGFGAGSVEAVSADGRMITLGFDILSYPPIVGASVMVCGGSGIGQHATVTGSSSALNAAGRNTTLLHLSSPLDKHVLLAGGSTICVTATVGSKIVSGNTFEWGMVVQWYGTTMRGVIADNDFTDCNVEGGRGAIMGFGLCYGRPQPMWACEYTGNSMVRSNGITLVDSIDSNNFCNASTYPGPFSRYQVIRRNAISGVALSAAERNASSPPCGTIACAKMSTDVVVEGNTLSCPAGSTQPPIYVDCGHCKVTP